MNHFSIIPITWKPQRLSKRLSEMRENVLQLSDDFAEKYEGRAEEFVVFISDAEIAVPGTYQKTWDFLEKDKNSFNRHSNMHLIFEK